MSWVPRPGHGPMKTCEDVCMKSLKRRRARQSYWHQSHQANHPARRTVHLFANLCPPRAAVNKGTYALIPGGSIVLIPWPLYGDNKVGTRPVRWVELGPKY